MPVSFALVGQPIFEKERQADVKNRRKVSRRIFLANSKIAEVVRSLEPNPSMDNPHRSINDLAIAKLDIPVNVAEGHRPVLWEEPPNPRSTLYLLGGKRHGKRELVRQNLKDVQNVMRGAKGGFQYLMDTHFMGMSFDYEAGPAIIWRCEASSIKGDSGGLLVCAGNQMDVERYHYHAVGFQSHELTGYLFPREDPWKYWKVAYEIPEELKTNYQAVAPMETCMDLDLKIMADV